MVTIACLIPRLSTIFLLRLPSVPRPTTKSRDPPDVTSGSCAQHPGYLPESRSLLLSLELLRSTVLVALSSTQARLPARRRNLDPTSYAKSLRSKLLDIEVIEVPRPGSFTD